MTSSTRRILLALLPLLALLLAVHSLPAQTRRTTGQRVLEEKIFKRLEWLRTATGATFDERSLSSATAVGSERVVSSRTEVEAEVHAAINPTDTANIIVSPINSNSTNGVECPIYYTRDFGTTWTKSSFRTTPTVAVYTVLGGGDPVLAFDAGGTAYISWLSFYFKNGDFSRAYFTMFWARSNDGGATWLRSPTGVIIENQGSLVGSGSGVIVDKQWMAVDRTGGPYAGTLYTAYLESDIETDQSAIVLRLKRLNQMEFDQISVAVSGSGFDMVQFSSIDIDPAGGVHVSFFGSRDGSTHALYHALSTDGGESFAPPVQVSRLYVPNFTVPNTTIAGIDADRIYPSPHIAIDRSGGAHNGTLYTVWSAWGQTNNLGNGLDIFLSRSTDNGATWSTPQVVNDDPRAIDAQQYHPSIGVSPAGVVAVTWYDRRGDPAQELTNYMIAYSFDGGATFTPNAAVSAQPTDFSTVGARNGAFGIGEYTQVLTTAHNAIPVWTDGRNNNGNLDIYAAVVPIRSEPSGVERMSAISEHYAFGAAAFDGDGRLALAVDRAPEGTLFTLELVTLDGRRVGRWSDLRCTGRILTVDVGRVAAGRYLLRVSTGEGIVAVRSVQLRS